MPNADYLQVSWILDNLHEHCKRRRRDEQVEFRRASQEMMPWAGFSSTLVSGGCLLLSSDRLVSRHAVFVFNVIPHAFGLSFYMEAVFEVAYECQLQMIADVIVHGHVVADQVDAQRAITFTEHLLLIPCVTCGDLADCIVGEKASKSRHNLGVVSVYVIRHDDFFHHKHLKHLHNEQG